MDSTTADMYYIQLPTGGPTQGDIWAGLPSGTGANDSCIGLIITPRCDFTHSKSPVLNYLPIVSLEKYLRSVACFPHIEHLTSEIRDGLRGKVAVLNVDYLFDLDLPIREIRDEISKLHSESSSPLARQLEKAKSDFEAGYDKLQELTNFLAKPELSLSEIRSAFNRRRLFNIQRDLVKNNNADTYFLPPCAELIETPSLVLLRHIYTCPIQIVDRSRNEKVQDTELPASFPERLVRLSSPFIESLMAKFAALFARVGTRDIPEPAVQAFLIPDCTEAK